jgi:hypothetical protein
MQGISAQHSNVNGRVGTRKVLLTAGRESLVHVNVCRLITRVIVEPTANASLPKRTCCIVFTNLRSDNALGVSADPIPLVRPSTVLLRKFARPQAWSFAAGGGF